LVRGYNEVLAHPATGAQALESRVPGLDPGLVRAELTGLLPAFRAGEGGVGVLDPRVLSAWSDWELRFGIVRRRPDVAGMFDPRFVPAGSGA
jgi:hypothetical protein